MNAPTDTKAYERGQKRFPGSSNPLVARRYHLPQRFGSLFFPAFMWCKCDTVKLLSSHCTCAFSDCSACRKNSCRVTKHLMHFECCRFRNSPCAFLMPSG